MYQYFKLKQNRRGYHKEVPSFSFKKVSSTYMGCLIESLGERQAPERECDVFDVPFSDRANIVLHDHHKPYERVMAIAFNSLQRDEVVRWLQGSGRLETTNDEGIYFVATVLKIEDVYLYPQGLMKCKVTFLVNPYAYRKTGDVLLEVTNGQTFYNPGTWYSSPIFKLSGVGSGEVSINGESFFIENLTGELTINSELKKVYEGSINAGQKMSGNFPLLKPGKNIIKFNGGINSIKIIPKWCDL